MTARAGATAAPRLVLALAAISSGALTPLAASACDPRLRLVYSDEAPADRLTLANLSETPWALVELELDLGPAAGTLVFDTAPGGPGTSTFGAVTGDDLAEPPSLGDGAQRVTLLLKPIAAGGGGVVYLDLDDAAAGGYAPYVPLDALEGARASARFLSEAGREAESTGAFGAAGVALLAPPACV